MVVLPCHGQKKLLLWQRLTAAQIYLHWKFSSVLGDAFILTYLIHVKMFDFCQNVCSYLHYRIMKLIHIQWIHHLAPECFFCYLSLWNHCSYLLIFNVESKLSDLRIVLLHDYSAQNFFNKMFHVETNVIGNTCQVTETFAHCIVSFYFHHYYLSEAVVYQFRQFRGKHWGKG